MRAIKNIKDVVDWGLCTGCGACFYMCDKEIMELINIESIGIRPIFNNSNCENCTKCLEICPGYQIDATIIDKSKIKIDYSIGSTIEILEGYSADNEIRYFASSGGVITALALYCLEIERMDFVLHTGIDPTKPWLLKSIISKNKNELIENTGSRYAPSSPCDSLKLIEKSNNKCVFIGKPCDVAALKMLCKKNNKLKNNIGVVLTFFCAGTPSSNATIELLKQMDIDTNKAIKIRYRGEGWPGKFKVCYNNLKKEKTLKYEESWEFLQKFRPFRCHLCPDGMGELADISCGDAWHRYPDKNNIGQSLILIRTQRGQELLNRAVSKGYMKIIPSGKSEILKAQNLVKRRQEIFGRLFAMKILFIPTPHFNGFLLFKAWLHNPLWIKIKIVLGTLRRLITRGLWHRNPI